MTGETLLIVEDNLALREGLHDILTYDGFEVLTASNGQEALEVLNSSAAIPDLIISDIAMPVMDGYQFYGALQADRHWETIPFIFLTARGEKEDILAGKNLGVDDYLVKPVTRDELVTVVRARLDRSKQVRLKQFHQAMETLLTMLANAIEGRDLYTGGHVERVREYGLEIAAEFGWQGQVLEPILYGAILHDIGKVFVPDSVLNKPGPLDAAEWEIMKQHPVRGIELIKGIPFLSQTVPVIRHHHERWDGTGYPDGLAGEKIPLAARIISVADAFDAMSFAGRPHVRKIRTLEESFAEIQRCSGTQFDPAVVAAFECAWQNGKIHPIWQTWLEKSKEEVSANIAQEIATLAEDARS